MSSFHMSGINYGHLGFGVPKQSVIVWRAEAQRERNGDQPEFSQLADGNVRTRIKPLGPYSLSIPCSDKLMVISYMVPVREMSMRISEHHSCKYAPYPSSEAHGLLRNLRDLRQHSVGLRMTGEVLLSRAAKPDVLVCRSHSKIGRPLNFPIETSSPHQAGA